MDSLIERLAGKAKWFARVLIPILIFSASAATAATKPVGRVMMAQGRIQLIHADGTEVTARGGTYFLSGDTFKTSSKSRAQLRFEDGTLISLRPKSEFQVNEYNYDPKNKNNNRSVFSLVKGGFSTVSGWLGKLKPEGYEVRTPVAVVGIRGTHYELVLDNGLSAAVWQGGINIKNEAADLRLGYGASFNFAHVPSIDKPPVGLLTAPATIHPQAADLFVEGKDETFEAEEKETTSSSDDGSTSESGDDSAVTAISDDPTDSGPDPTGPANTDEGTVLTETTGTVEGTGAGAVLVADTTTTAAVVVPVNVAGATLRAYGVFTGNSVTPMAIGSSPDLSGGGGFIYDPNLFYDGTQGFVVALNAATNFNLGSYTANAASINYGKWDTGGGANKIKVYTDPNDDVFLLQETQSMYWLTMTPTATMPVTGSFNYNLTNFTGTGSGGALTNTLFTTNVNFGTGQLAGSLNMTDAGANTWATNFSGGINGADMQASLNGSSTVNGVAASGNINGSFSGTSAAGLGAVFDFNGGGKYATGVFVAQQGVTTPYLSAADNTDLANAKLAGYGTVGGGGTILKGTATDLSSAGTNSIIYDVAQSLVARPGVDLAIRSAASSYTGPGAAAGATIKWGVWNGSAASPIDIHTNSADISVKNSLINPMYWLTMNETVTMPGTGVFNYSLANLSGTGTGGVLTGTNFTGKVDFANSTVVGAADIADGVNNWATTYTGAIAGSKFAATLDAASTVTSPGPTTVAATGTIDGSFSGANADTMAGMFNFTDGGGLYANGVFILDNPTTQPVLTAADDIDLTAAALRGFAVFGGTSTSAPMYGDATDLGTGSTNPVIYDSTIQVIARPGTGTTKTTSGTYATSNGKTVTWGDWGGGVIDVYTNPADVNTVTGDNNSMYWLTMNTAGTTMPTTGAFYYTSLAGSPAGAGTAGVFGSASMDAEVDFATGWIRGGLALNDGANDWQTNYAGTIAGAEFDATLQAGSTVNGNAAQGALHGGFTGTNADALAGVFNLEQVGSPGIYADGTFALAQSTQPYLTIMQQMELAAANRVGLAIFGNPDFTVQQPLIGVTTADMSSTGVAGNQLLYDATQSIVMSANSGTTTYSVEDKFTAGGGAKNSAGVALTSVDIQWGDWNTQAIVQTSPTDASIGGPATMASNFMSWINMTPTAVMPTTGSVTYSLAGFDSADPASLTGFGTADSGGGAYSLYGTGNGISIGVGKFAATVDFGTGNVAGTVALVDGAQNNWNVQYNAAINGTTFSTTTFSTYTGGGATGQFTGAGGASFTGDDTVTGFIGGGFSGTDGSGNPEAIGGAFQLQNATDASESIGGTFVMTQ